ncbi:MAG: cryptochrome/photolyase family protein [Verrucomicrobia bacterium]|nr:cryptochrome/photolyase family protein [Verrucomicrobiota bacterium]
MNFHPQTRPRHLVLVLGDQLNQDSAAFDGFNPACDAVWMAEVAEESTRVWSHKSRVAMFLSAMRHFRDTLRSRGVTVHYRQLQDAPNSGNLCGELTAATSGLRPQGLIWVQPGEWRVQSSLESTARALGVDFEVRPDRHFFCSTEEFAQHARGRKQLRMEFFYRELRRRHRVLMDGDEPEGGAWNFDSENRESFGKNGPDTLRPQPRRFEPDAVTREVLDLVNKRFARHPGKLDDFDWPVTTADAELALQDFIKHRLPEFGRWQDAMWTSEPWLYHSRLSAAMNLKLLDPRRVIAAAEKAFRKGRAPLADVEGLIRQILGWREYVRGIYWLHMPGYLERNALNAHHPLPAFYWTGETDMACLRDAIGQTLRYGYAHHIQRLMVTGLFALLWGAHPQRVHEWYLAVYVDAVEWVELPNTLGMSQYADGGVMASKPYIASGKYLQRMSNFCAGCRYDPAQRTGPKACPFTTLYWDFLLRHETMLGKNPRTVMQVRNAARLTPAQRREITDQADRLRAAIPAAT